MWTSRPRTGLYCNWSVGTLTTSRRDGSDRVEYHTISLFQILRCRVPVWYLWRSLVRHSNGQVQLIAGGVPKTCILIVDYGVWCRTSFTQSPEPPLRLMQSMYIPMGISCRRKTPTHSVKKSGHGAYLRALKDKASAWYWGLAISRSVIDNPSGLNQSSASLIPMLDKLRQNG